MAHKAEKIKAVAKGFWWLLTHPKKTLSILAKAASADDFVNYLWNNQYFAEQYLNRCKEVDNSLTLNAMGVINGTDKADIYLPDYRMSFTHDYLRHYEWILNNLRADDMTVVEFGCQRGSSLRMWKSFFSNAKIVGVDLDPEARKSIEDRISIIIGDATDESTRDKITSQCDNIMICIDDASHAWSDQRRTFELFWPILGGGGVLYC